MQKSAGKGRFPDHESNIYKMYRRYLSPKFPFQLEFHLPLSVVGLRVRQVQEAIHLPEHHINHPGLDMFPTVWLQAQVTLAMFQSKQSDAKLEFSW